MSSAVDVKVKFMNHDFILKEKELSVTKVGDQICCHQQKVVTDNVAGYSIWGQTKAK